MDDDKHVIGFDLAVPPHMVDSDGNLKPAFYEMMFNMLGTEIGGATVKSINVVPHNEA